MMTNPRRSCAANASPAGSTRRDDHTLDRIRNVEAADDAAVQLAHRHPKRHVDRGLRRPRTAIAQSVPPLIVCAQRPLRELHRDRRLPASRTTSSRTTVPGCRPEMSRISSSLVTMSRPSSWTMTSYGRTPARSAGEPAVTSCTSAPRETPSFRDRCSAGVTSVSSDADEAARHPAARLQLRQDGHRLVDRHGEADVARARADGRVDADHLAARVDQRTAAVAEIDGRVGLDVVVEAVVEQLPADEAHDADGDRMDVAERVADRAHPLADPKIVGVPERRVAAARRRRRS